MQRTVQRRRYLATGIAAILVCGSVGWFWMRSASDLESGPAEQLSAQLQLDLPMIPWEGGADYWKQFPRANAAGWSDPSFFPVVAWYDGISSNEEVQYDKDLGINTYIGMSAETPFELFIDNDVFWIGNKLNATFDESSPNWVGDFLDDEVDGRFAPADGRAHLTKIIEDAGADGRFKYANFTQTVIGDLATADAEAYINQFTDVVSIDMYWYTIPFCDLRPFRGEIYLTPVAESNCRTASSYGNVMKALRVRDSSDGELQALWQFIENFNGGPGGEPFVRSIDPGEVKGAVIASVINEARGLVYFNQSLSGPCQGGNMFRLSQIQKEFCGADQIDAMKQVNAQIRNLAPVINTQSYDYSFGTGLNTMLKVQGASAYIFAMVDGRSKPGQRELLLPSGISGSEAEVLFEDRKIPVTPEGKFSDSFDEEYSYHIYKIAR